MTVNEGPDREFYALMYPRTRARKKKQPREKPIERPRGFCHTRRHKPTEDELFEKFTAEMEAQGRAIALLDDEDGELFERWRQRNGFDY
jgi:hypothetical protein